MAIDRRRRPLIRDGLAVRDARLFVIASEGEKTEPLYFSAFKSRRMQVVTLPSAGGRSSPTFVLEALDDYARRFDIGEDDELWLVIDRDRWASKMLSIVGRQCAQKRYGIAISNPNFEIWLAYHFGSLPTPTTKASVLRALVDNLGIYNKARFDVDALRPLAAAACAHARADDTNPSHMWPVAPGSRVYRLMDRMLQVVG